MIIYVSLCLLTYYCMISISISLAERCLRLRLWLTPKQILVAPAIFSALPPGVPDGHFTRWLPINNNFTYFPLPRLGVALAVHLVTTP